MSRPGTIIEPYKACRLGVERHRAVPQRPAVGVADEDLGRRPEVVLVERVALDLERVIDPDRLVGDLLAIAIDRELGREVAGLAGLEEPLRLEAEVLDDEDAATRSAGRLKEPSTSSSGCSSPNFVVTAAATMNRISPRWVSNVASFVYWWRSPYRYVRPAAAVSSRSLKRWRRRTSWTPRPRHPPSLRGRAASDRKTGRAGRRGPRATGATGGASGRACRR